jgi:hypothetical protein
MDLNSTRWAPRTGWTVVVLACLFTFIGSSARAQETDLDALMARCLERRNETWRVLHDYVLDERERFGLVGPSDVRLFGSDRQYTWYVQDGILVRSPVRFNGVAVPDKDRREYEARWLNEERSRAERAQRKSDEKKNAQPDARKDGPEDGENERTGDQQDERTKDKKDARAEEQSLAQPGAAAGEGAAEIAAKGLEPRFVSEANFLRFRFERGRYFLVGREQLDGRSVLKVEYYPKKLFVDADDPDRKHKEDAPTKDPATPDKRHDKGKAMEEEFDRKFNKVSMVTLWIDPVESQIVRYDFENLGLDFFPGQWLVRVGETSASMTMGRYFDGVWLPKAIVLKGDLQVAIGSFDIDYRREFLEYRKAETSSRIRGYGDVK